MQGTSFSCPGSCSRLLWLAQPECLHCSRAAVPELNPAAASAAKANAILLQAAEAHLGNSLSELYVAMPMLAACGFKVSFGKRPAEMLAERVAGRMRQTSRAAGDAASTAVAAIGPSIGVDMEALRSLVVSTRSALAEASR